MKEARIAVVLERIAIALERQGIAPRAEDFDNACCWRWEAAPLGGRLTAIERPQFESLDKLRGLDKQIALVDANTRCFLRGAPSCHVLLTGPRGTGKSSVVRGVFSRHADSGLRLIECDAAGLAQLPAILPALAMRREKFILYCDDLSFGRSNTSTLFQRLKSALEGGFSGTDNLRVYSTSNRRHLISENYDENLEGYSGGDEIHPGETNEEKISLSDRFGLWIPFCAPTVQEYEQLVRHWLGEYGVAVTAARLGEARLWADRRGSVSGRVARHFAIACAAKSD
ncbi:ATP-binding protein [Candidatus Persebacteraceae bacterium Df01]|jgi:hypothetical protein|uniref:ATP-binding protein n=1 Tax=Candidatus Doriopsillibacter californiensis TaxID=2970740 RepID=A0ABT7QK80_9GAMM|nr:ATP-binding protein [Candidatus Persebacteraceae bacterium Df01]